MLYLSVLKIMAEYWRIFLSELEFVLHSVHNKTVSQANVEELPRKLNIFFLKLTAYVYPKKFCNYYKLKIVPVYITFRYKKFYSLKL